MSIIKRLSTTLFSRIDQVVGEIENHDALIDAAITEQRKKIAAAKVQQAKVQRQQRRLEQQLDQLREEESRWASRAVQTAEKDESRALACMQRRKQLGEQMVRQQAAIDEYASTASRMGADIQRAEQEQHELSQKHALLRARQSSGEALGVSDRIGMSHLDELEASFERWEVRIAQDEIINEVVEPIDELEASYRSQEEEEALRDELQALMAGEKHDER